jgi:CBS domain-containing protein
MRMQIAALERSISDSVPHIFKRPVLTVGPTDSLLQVGTFLAIGPQIYVDGLVVLDGKRLVGTVGGQHMIRYILEHQEGWFESTASQIMKTFPSSVEGNDPLGVALDIFGRTKFAFVPVMINGLVATSLSVRDVLPIAAGSLVKPVGELSSPLISVKGGISIQRALELMLEKGVRNLAVRNENNQTKIINDRKILEFILSYEGRRLVSTPMGLDSVSIELLDLQIPRYVKKTLPAGIAAESLSSVTTPCLLCNGSIITPWDIVMKGLLRE